MDVIAVNKFILGMSDPSDAFRKAADMDHNGVIDSNDSLLVLRKVVG